MLVLKDSRGRRVRARIYHNVLRLVKMEALAWRRTLANVLQATQADHVKHQSVSGSVSMVNVQLRTLVHVILDMVGVAARLLCVATLVLTVDAHHRTFAHVSQDTLDPHATLHSVVMRASMADVPLPTPVHVMLDMLVGDATDQSAASSA